jgi:hypothetical protein
MTEPRYTLDDLEAHGLDARRLPVEQQEVLRALTPAELALLVEIRARLDEVGPEVEAHSEIAGAALF